MPILSPAERQFLAVLLPRFVPPAEAYTATERTCALDLIDEALADRPPALQRQFSVLLGVVRWAPLVRYGQPLDRLDPARQETVLRWFQHAPVLLLRAGFWGLRTLVFLGCYGRPQAAPSLAYRPVFDGNVVLHARTPR